MKTKYRNIYFNRTSTVDIDGKSIWFCQSNKTSDVLGTVMWHQPWRRWVFEGE